MNAALLLDHYARIADAPDAIARLRRFVLDLAVRGKLVEQDEGDEPASELLKRIAAENLEASVRGLDKALRTKREDLPFTPPKHWEWAKLVAFSEASYGFAFASNRFNSNKVGMPLIRIRDISGTDTEAYFDGEYDPWYVVKTGDYLVGMDGDFNLRRWRGGDALLNQRVLRLSGWRCGIEPEFVRLPLQMTLDHLHGGTSQTTVKHLSAKQVNGIEIPLPPLAEQHRIVAKVDELMALCDQLEAARAERETSRDTFMLSTLAKLNTPDPETYGDDARFALANLAPLTTRTDQIKRLRQTILNLAVFGKLVEQDADHEPALSYLTRLSEVPGNTRKLQKEVELGGNNYPLPDNWAWVPLGALVRGMDAGWSPQCENHPRSDESQWGVLKTTAVQALSFDARQHKQLPEKLSPRPAMQANVGDILVTRAGPKNRVGVSCVVDAPCPRLMISDKLIRFHGLGDLSARYLALTLNAGETLHQIECAKSGMAVMQMNISQEKLRAVLIPLPPVPEQHRIVAKVDELMTLCDQLEASLTTGEQTRSRLLEAVLHNALEPA